MSQDQEEGRPVRPRSPISEVEDFQPPAPALRASQPFHSNLGRLPEVLLASLCSFLTARAVHRLAATCSALSRQCFPSTVALCQRNELLQPGELPQQQAGHSDKALGTLLRRGADRLKSLRVKDPDLIEPFMRALRTTQPPLQLGLLTFLRITVGPQPVETSRVAQPSKSEGVVVVLGDVLGQLPMLRALHLEMITDMSLLSPLWRVLRKGACPKLERIELDDCSPAVLVGLASALPSRPEGCARLKALTVHIRHQQPCQGLEEACQALAAGLSADGIEEMCVYGLQCPAEWFNAVVSRLSTCEWPTLRVLFLSAGAVTDERECDALLHALAHGRACAKIAHLLISSLRCSDDAWRVLSEAMATGPCLRRLRELALRHVFQGTGQMETFARGIGAGHGCPDLELLTLNPYDDEGAPHEETDWSALAHALRPPSGLPQLRSLNLTTLRPSRIGALMEALEHRPHAIEPLRRAQLAVASGIADPALPTSMVDALADGGALAGLRMLQVIPFIFDEGGATASWVWRLLEALEAGGGKQLRMLQCSLLETAEAPAAMINRLLHALVRKGACPELRQLLLELPASMQHVIGGGIQHVIGGGLDMGLLQALLTGGAACSAKLGGVSLASYGFGAAELVALEACLRDPRVVQLGILKLLVIGEDTLPALLALLEALGHGRAGVRLNCLSIEARDWTESQAMVVVHRLVDIICPGGCPPSPHSSPL